MGQAALRVCAVALLGLSMAVAVSCGPADDTDGASTPEPSSSETNTLARSDESPTPLVTQAALELEFFQSPTGNIACHVKLDGASCEISEKTFTPPPKPADCEYDFGNLIFVADGETGFGCVSDTFRFQEMPTLEYGSTARRGNVGCTSSVDGVRCVDDRNGHGFTVSRATYSLF